MVYHCCLLFLTIETQNQIDSSSFRYQPHAPVWPYYTVCLVSRLIHTLCQRTENI